MYGRHRVVNEWLVGPLQEKGLLLVLEPESFVDQGVAESLAEIMTELIAAGAFDDLDLSVHFAELSHSRTGWNADIGLSEMLVDELLSRGLARRTEDGVSVPLHPVVRTTFLIVLAQLARGAGRRNGMDLHPVTSQGARVQDLMSALKQPSTLSTGHVVALDLEAVTLNLESVPLEDVLDFRAEHRSQHRTYSRSVRKAIRDLSVLPDEERGPALADRREELADMATDLRKLASKRWRMPLAHFGLGGAGAVIDASIGNLPAAAIAFANGILGTRQDDVSVAAYSYLFNAERSLSK